MTNLAEVNKRAPKVLIADDDPGIVRFLASRCAKMGFEVQTATNGLQTLIMSSRDQPDVLIVDINMPELDGLSVSARLLEPSRKPVEIIVITASSYPETMGRCESFGAAHVRKGADLWNGVQSALIEIFPDMAQKIVEEKKSPSLAETWTRPRVLVVDADPDVGLFLASRLRKCGVDTLHAYDAVQGYRIACKEEPSVIIMDYLIPKGDAPHLLSRLRSTPATDRIPVFVMTARRLDDTTEEELTRDICGRPGVTKFLVKSSDTQALFSALQKLCGFNNNPNLKENIGELPK